MPEEPAEPVIAPSALARAKRPRQSRWPLIIVLGLLAALIAGSVLTVIRPRTGDEPWRIDYPGVTWVQGVDSATAEGKRYIQGKVRFDQEVVGAYNVKDFLTKLVNATRGTYDYYHIMVVNRNNAHVLDAVADKSGLHSISITRRYEDQ